MRLRDVPHLLTPPVLGLLARRLRRQASTRTHGLSGNYRNWQEALAASTGYDSEAILERTRLSLLKVKNGEAAHERDSVLFDRVEHAWPVLAGLLWVAARSGGSLSVLDFGGSLGSTYFQNRAFLSSLPQLRWNIVEQPGHVETGKAWFQDNTLRFYENIADCLAETQPTVVLLSSVLQYLADPHRLLAQILALPIAHIIIDRTPFWSGQIDRLTVEVVRPSIYPASYPAWILSSTRFRACLERDWAVVAEFDALDHLAAPVTTTWQGMILERRPSVTPKSAARTASGAVR